MTEKKIQSTEYNPALQPLVSNLYSEPVNKGSAFGYYAENEPESTMDIMNAHSNQIMNKTASTLYRMADTLYGPFMSEEAREQLQLDLEQMREDYIDTENNINKYLYNYASGSELVALSIGGMLYRGFADPVNQAINLGLGGSGFFINLLADGTQYMADTSFYENRNIITDPKIEDIANIGMNAAISYGTMKIQGKYADITDKMLYEDTGKFNKTNLQWENPRLEDKYLIDVNNPAEFLPTAKSTTALAPLDRLMRVNQDNSDLLEVMKQRGYDTLISTKDAAEVATRQIYGQPQGNYTKQGTEEGIKNFIENVTRLNRTYQKELAKSRKDLELKTGKKTNSRISTLDLDTDMGHGIKPLETNIEMNINQILAEDAREFSRVTGINKPFGNAVWDFSQDIDSVDFVQGLQGRAIIKNQNFSSEFMDLIKKKLNEYIALKSGNEKALNIEYAYYSDVLYNKKTYLENIRAMYEDQDIEGIRKLSTWIGKEVSLTEAEAKSVGIPWDSNSLTGTKLITGKELETTKKFSIFDYPFQMAELFYREVSSTTHEAMKGNGVVEYRTKYDVGEKWGNKGIDGSLGGFHNFMKSMEGYEESPYKIITTIFSDVAKEKSGLNRVAELIDDLGIDTKNYSENLSIKEKWGLYGLEKNVRETMKTQLERIYKKNNVYGRYKPNTWIDPDNERITSDMTSKALKGFMSFKFLGNLNYLREFSQNNFRINSGARKLGWKKSYSILKDYSDIAKVNYQLINNWQNIKNGTIDKITDPLIKRRVQLFIDKKMSNDVIWNDPTQFTFGLKVERNIQKGLTKLGNIAGTGQLISDVHRISTAEFMAINFLKDGFQETNSPLLTRILRDNGILNNEDFLKLTTRLNGMSFEDLAELVWSGKTAANMIDYKIQSLFEQFSSVMAKDFNAYKKSSGGFLEGKVPKLYDFAFLYKRYSISALENFQKNISTYISDDGFIRKRYSSNLSFKENYKNMFKGFNVGYTFPIIKTAVSSYLTYQGVKWIHGKMSGSTEDERAEAKFESLTSIPGIWWQTANAVSSFVTDYTGIGLVYGGSSVVGGLYDTAIARAKRAATAENLETWEKIYWFTRATISPEFIARGIDNIKLQKNIPTRLTTFSDEEKFIWKTDKRIDAEIEQLEGKVPFEIDWENFWSKRIDKAREFTNAQENISDDVVVMGAAGMSELMEQSAEMTTISELMAEDKEVREKGLKLAGLDIDSLLSRMEIADVRNFNAAVSFMKIRDEEELLMCAYSYLKSKDKKGFIDSMMTDDEKMFFNAYKDNIQKNRKQINNSIAKERGIDNYIKSLDIINGYANGQMN